MRRLMPSAKWMAMMYRRVSETVAAWARRAWATVRRWLGFGCPSASLRAGEQPKQQGGEGTGDVECGGTAPAFKAPTCRGTPKHREEMMGEIEELKAKLEGAEQRAARAESALGRIAEREKTDEEARSGQSATSESSESSESSGSSGSSGSSVGVTNPANSDAGQRSRLAAAAALAARGDRRALLEWATLREELNVARRNE